MERMIVVEVLDRFGKVRQRHRLRRFPATIGRGYDNDIILDDPHVSARHLKLDFDAEGRLFAHDLDSDNGLYAVAPLKRVDSLWLKSGGRLRIGHTELQVFFPDHPVPAAVLDRAKPAAVTLFFSAWPGLLLTWLVLAGVMLARQVLELEEEATLGELLLEMAPVFVGLLAWTGAWSVASRAVTHRFYFALHGSFAGGFLLADMFTQTLAEYVEFAFMLDGAVLWLGGISGVVLLALLLYGHLRYATTLQRRRAWRVAGGIALAVALLFAGGLWVIHDQDHQRLAFSHYLKPPRFALASPVEVEEFLAAAATLAPGPDED